MATVEDLPPDLRALGRRVPATALVNMSQPELECRCAEASALLAEADSEPDESRARRKRREAERYLQAMSMVTLTHEANRLSDALEKATLEQGGYAARALAGELEALYRDNPQPLERMAGLLLQAANDQIEQRAAENRIRRTFKRKGK